MKILITYVSGDSVVIDSVQAIRILGWNNERQLGTFETQTFGNGPVRHRDCRIELLEVGW